MSLTSVSAANMFINNARGLSSIPVGKEELSGEELVNVFIGAIGLTIGLLSIFGA